MSPPARLSECGASRGCPGAVVVPLVAPVELGCAALLAAGRAWLCAAVFAVGACFVGVVLSVTAGAVCFGAGGSTGAPALLALGVVPVFVLPPHPASAIVVASRAVVASERLLPRVRVIITRLRRWCWWVRWDPACCSSR